MTNWRHSAASPPCGSLVCARFIQLDRADAEHWHFLIESLRAGVPERVPCGQAASLASETTQTESACAPVKVISDPPALASAALGRSTHAINFADLGSAKTGSESTHTQGGEQRRSV